MRTEPRGATIGRGRCGKLPWLTALIVAAALGVHACAVAPLALAYAPGSAAWRLLTCHVAHFSQLHAQWDIATFALLGVVAERESRGAQALFLAAAALLVPLYVHRMHPSITHYAGLSGLVLGQLALVFGLRLQEAYAHAARTRAWVLLLLSVVLLAKEWLELVLGHTTLIRMPYQGFVSVPAAHVASVVIGFATALLVATHPLCRDRCGLGCAFCVTR